MLKEAAKPFVEEVQENPHVTLMYCGKEITDEDAETIMAIFKKHLKSVPWPARIWQVSGEFELFGMDKNVLVVHCHMNSSLVRAINSAREEASEKVPAIPKSDFDFSPHMTLGFGAKDVPDEIDQQWVQFFSVVKGYGDNYVQRAQMSWQLFSS